MADRQDWQELARTGKMGCSMVVGERYAGEREREVFGRERLSTYLPNYLTNHTVVYL